MRFFLVGGVGFDVGYLVEDEDEDEDEECGERVRVL